MTKTKIGVLGAGTWGTALARMLAGNGCDVTMWSALPDELKAMSVTHAHPNLPGMCLPADMHYTADIEEICGDRDVLLFAVPSVFVRSTARKAAPHIPDGQLIVDVAKGVEEKTLMTMSEIIEQELAADGKHTHCNVVALSGPTHAEEVARDMPTLIVAGSPDEAAARKVQQIFTPPPFRVYTNTDRRGVELGGAVKNVIALAVGIAMGLDYGDNAKAALITRGNAELARLGVAMGCLLLVPAVLSLLQNPRTIDLASGWGFLTYGKVQQYLAILLSWVMPPDSPYLTSIWSEGVIKWTSMSAYLPLCSLAGALAYWRARHGDSKKRIVAVCAVCALVPILNSAFYALNSSYYARWYYMPVLILAAMTVNALEDHNTDLDTPARGLGWIMLATLAFALVPVLDNDTGTWSLGVLKNPGQYFVVLGFGLGGLLLYRLICQKWRADSRFAQRMTAAVVAFACVFSMVHIGIGKFGQWYTDSDLVEQDNNALLLKEDLPEGDYRVDTYKIHDNIGMWLDKSCLQYFGSTAAPSILSFYPALGVKRDVRSEPELSNYALRGLLSVEYLITTPEQQADFESQADDGWAYYDELDGFVLYKNKNYVPMGFTYDYYVTEETYGQVNKNSRANLLMRAMVLSDEDAAVYGKYLAELPTEKQSELTYEAYVQDCNDRRAQACSMFQMNNAGFHAEITLENANLVFFSVPYDDGFTAYVNGEQTDIVRVDDGMMAVLCPAGTSSIDFVYQADGLALSRTVTLAALPVWLVYTAYFVWRKRKKSKV